MFFAYRFYDKVCKVYAPLSFVETEPKTYFKRLHATALTDPSKLVSAELHRDYVDCIGVYNQETGTLEPVPELFGETHFDIQEDLLMIEELRRQANGNSEA